MWKQYKIAIINLKYINILYMYILCIKLMTSLKSPRSFSDLVFPGHFECLKCWLSPINHKTPASRNLLQFIRDFNFEIITVHKVNSQTNVAEYITFIISNTPPYNKYFCAVRVLQTWNHGHQTLGTTISRSYEFLSRVRIEPITRRVIPVYLNVARTTTSYV